MLRRKAHPQRAALEDEEETAALGRSDAALLRGAPGDAPEERADRQEAAGECEVSLGDFCIVRHNSFGTQIIRNPKYPPRGHCRQGTGT